MTKLKEYYLQLISMKFPISAIENDDLADFYSELVEIDGYYAGLIKSKLKNLSNTRKAFDFSYLKNLRKKLEKIDKEILSKKDKSAYDECNNYLAFLEKLPKLSVK